MIFSYQKNLNLLTVIVLQIVLNFVSLSTITTKAHSYPTQTINKNQKIQNKQSSTRNQFKLVYDSNTQYKYLEDIFRQSQLFNVIINDLNQLNLNLPVDIPVVFGDCGQANAMYSPSRQEVRMCYELFENIFDSLSTTYSDEKELAVNSITTGAFILYHEIGHALIDILDLAITGKEEDAVDDFAAVLLLQKNNSKADTIILNSSLYFSSHPDSPYWDEHSFGQQRFYNLLCLLYGKNPQQYSQIPQQIGLGGRAERCPGEYQQKLSSWQRLLAPHSIYDDSRNSPSNSTIKW